MHVFVYRLKNAFATQVVKSLLFLSYHPRKLVFFFDRVILERQWRWRSDRRLELERQNILVIFLPAYQTAHLTQFSHLHPLLWPFLEMQLWVRLILVTVKVKALSEARNDKENFWRLFHPLHLKTSSLTFFTFVKLRVCLVGHFTRFFRIWLLLSQSNILPGNSAIEWDFRQYSFHSSN